jgi:anti-anti-sigma regulatory factor
MTRLASRYVYEAGERGVMEGRDVFRITPVGRHAVVTAPQRVTAQNAHDFWTALALASPTGRALVIDLRPTRCWEQPALGALLMALRLSDRSGSGLRVVAARGIQRALTAEGLDKLLTIVSSLSEALESSSS